MIEYIQSFYLLSTNLFYVLLFSFIYIPLFNKCNVKKKVIKNDKTKIISQPKSVLALTYLILLYILFKCFTLKMVLFITIVIFISSLTLIDNLSPILNESLYKLNKSSIMILFWKLLHTIFTIINVITYPFFSIINNQLTKQYDNLKNLILKISNNTDGLNNIIEKEILKISDDMSNMSDYIYNTKTKNKLDNKEKEKKIEFVNSKDIFISDINTNDYDSSSKTMMIKKINEIKKVVDDVNSDSVEDMELTEISK